MRLRNSLAVAVAQTMAKRVPSDTHGLAVGRPPAQDLRGQGRVHALLPGGWKLGQDAAEPRLLDHCDRLSGLGSKSLGAAHPPSLLALTLLHLRGDAAVVW